MPKYSIVIPLHNEQENVTDLYDRLKAVMETNGEGFEIVFVDDGSSDDSFPLLRQIAGVDSRVTVVRLRRNFGQTSALAAGFDHARGEYIIAMDGDSTFKAYRREILEQVPLYGELHRFIPALASWHGASICEVPIRNVNRERGNSHYGISRTFRVFFDLITIRFLLKYLGRPLHFFGTVGMLGILAGTGITFWLFVEKFVHHTHVMMEHGPMMIFAAVLLLAGLNLLAIGLLGELQVRHYHEPTRRAPYSVDRVLRAHSEEQSVPE